MAGESLRINMLIKIKHTERLSVTCAPKNILISLFTIKFDHSYFFKF